MEYVKLYSYSDYIMTYADLIHRKFNSARSETVNDDLQHNSQAQDATPEVDM